MRDLDDRHFDSLYLLGKPDPFLVHLQAMPAYR